MTREEWDAGFGVLRDAVANAGDALGDWIRRGFDEGLLEPCRTGDSPPGWYVHCHRGGIGCPLLHEHDPPELRNIEREYRPRAGLRNLLLRLRG